MPPVRHEDEARTGPGTERGIQFQCSQCRADVWIGNPSTIASSLFSGVAALAGLAYVFSKNITGFISTALFKDPSIMSGAVGVILTGMILAFAYGGFGQLKWTIEMIRQRRNHPLLNPPSRSADLSKTLDARTLGLGLLPWTVAVGLGRVNDSYLGLGESAILVLLAVLGAPIYFAPKFGVSRTALFLACGFWLAVGGGAAWIFG